MRIGFDAKRATHNFRGLGNYSRGIIDGIHQYSSNSEILLFTPQFNNELIDKWIKEHARIELHYPQNIIGKIFPSIWRSFLLEDQLNQANLDIYHGLSHELPFFSRKHKFKSVVTIHDLLFMRYPENFPFIDRKIYYQKFKYAAENADLVIAICEQTKKDIINFLNIPEKKILVHYQSISPLFYKTNTPEEIKVIKERFHLNRNYILHVGAFEKNKNQLNVLKSFEKVKDDFEIDLVFVGNGKRYLEQVEQEIQKLKLNSRVHILNNVSFNELPLIYQGANLLCFPSFFEGFGIPIVEALFSKVPVITTQGFCFPESAGPHSIYCDPHDVLNISDSICLVLSDLELQNKMKNEGFKYAQRFTLESTTNKLIELYTQLLSN